MAKVANLKFGMHDPRQSRDMTPEKNCIYAEALDRLRVRLNMYLVTSEDNLVDDLRYEVPIGKSDHVCLSWNFVLESAQPSRDSSTTGKRTTSQSTASLNRWTGTQR